MPRMNKRISLTDLPFEPLVKDRTTDWTPRSHPPIKSTELHAAVDSLKPRHRYVIEHRYGLDGPQQTLAEIGRCLGCTKERVRQYENEAVQVLKGRFGQQ